MKAIIKYVCAILVCLVTISLTAQEPVSKRDKIEGLRVAFINGKVNFTSQEAQAFWPLYKEYNDKLESAKKTFRQQYIKNTDFTTITDKEAEAYLTAELAQKQKEYDLYKEYFGKFKKVLPIKKVALLRRAEEEFRKELIKSIKAKATAEQ